MSIGDAGFLNMTSNIVYDGTARRIGTLYHL